MDNKVFFTSDLHLFHNNILKFDNSPYKNIGEQHGAIINNWSSMVNPNDEVYVLGDCVLWGNPNNEKVEKVSSILNSLTGKLHLIKGNHEHFVLNSPKLCSRFESINDYKEITLENIRICMFHYPIHEWNQAHRGSWMLHGHTHKMDDYDKSFKRVNVGIMNWNYCPVSFERLKLKMSDLTVKTHH